MSIAMYGLIWSIISYVMGLIVGQAVHSRKASKETVIRQGDNIFCRQYFTDERGNRVKNRFWTVMELCPASDDETITFLTLVGNEPEDKPSRAEFNLKESE